MAKVRFKKRIMPRDGRMVNGCYKSDYSQGYDDAFDNRLGTASLVPMQLTSRSRAYWNGYRKGYQARTGQVFRNQSLNGFNTLRLQQQRQLETIVRETGFDIDKYLAQGGTLKDALYLTGITQAR